MTAAAYRLVVGPLILVLAVSVYRSWILASEISSDRTGLFAGLLISDGVTLGLAFLLAAAAAMTRRRGIRWLVLGLMGAVTFAHFLDAFIVLSVDERLNLLDLRQYLPEFDVIASFLSPPRLALLLVFLASFLLAVRVYQPALMALIVVALVAIGAGLVGQARYPDSIQRYTTPVVAVVTAGLADRSRFRYAPDELPHYQAQYREHQQASPLPGQPNMILLIVESLSSINSQRVSGERDWLPGFDKLSREGLLFVNFFANHAASEGGMISLLSGVPPMHYPGARPLMFEEFQMQWSILRSLQHQGYYTAFLTSTRLDFITMDEYLRGIGFDEASGRDEVATLASAPRYAQDAPSDDLLYTEVLSMLDRLRDRSPWLLVLATASSHLPYTHPAGGEDSPEAVWAWVDEQLAAFHEALQAQGFYENGVLLVTGDHRQMRPVTDAERERYGKSAKARIPLLIIGRGIPTGITDERFFQQSDLFRRLAAVPDPDALLSPNPIWVKRYNRKYGKIGRTGHLTVFAEADGSDGTRGYELYVFGNAGEWLGERPPGARRVESMVHAQRAAHQHTRNLKHSECIAAADDSRRIHSGDLTINEAGAYWFRLDTSDPGACLRLDGETVIPPGTAPGEMVQVQLEIRSYRLELLSVDQPVSVEWLTPRSRRSAWTPVPLQEFNRNP